MDETILIDTGKERLPSRLSEALPMLKRKSPESSIEDLMVVLMELNAESKPSIISRINNHEFSDRSEIPDWQDIDRRQDELRNYLLKKGQLTPDDFE